MPRLGSIVSTPDFPLPLSYQRVAVHHCAPLEGSPSVRDRRRPELAHLRSHGRWGPVFEQVLPWRSRWLVSLIDLSAEVTTDAGRGVDPSGAIRPNSEIRMVRSRQPDPLAFIMFDWVLGAHLFLPWREQAPIGDIDGERRPFHLRPQISPCVPRVDVGFKRRGSKSAPLCPLPGKAADITNMIFCL
jgi:hypothetical protein